MPDSYLIAPGDIIAVDELATRKAKEVVHAVQAGRLPFVHFVECRRVDNPATKEVVVLEVEVELPQRLATDIQRIERVAVVFSSDDRVPPEVLALRESFPLVPHLNLRVDEFPRSLCIFEERFSELNLRWSAVTFIETIRRWLAQTATGTLHAADQPLEPLLLGPVAPIIVPDTLLPNQHDAVPGPIELCRADGGRGRLVLFASAKGDRREEQTGPKFVLTVIYGLPQQHGLIRRTPASLYDLHQFLTSAGIDLLAELRRRLRSWQSGSTLTKLKDAKLVIVIHLPKVRSDATDVESLDTWAFLTTEPILKIGQEIGGWQVSDGQAGILLTPDESKNGNTVGVVLLRPMSSFSRPFAAQLSGLKDPYQERLVLVGVGALGSQVFLNLVRAGFGQWLLVDDDYLLPHNMARHALFGDAVGYAKAPVLAAVANGIIDGEPIADYILADVLNPGADKQRLLAGLQESPVILDASASVSVARHLALDVDSPARRISLFLNPSGMDLVLLVEDSVRNTPLDLVEMQYYRHIASATELHDHLRVDRGEVRYSRSCRDLTMVIPEELVSLHAAIASRAVRVAVQQEEASIGIWQVANERLGVRDVGFRTWPLVERQVGEWRIRSDQFFLEEVSRLRLERLPNETGGVLVGAFDMQRKIIYIMDTIPSPPDSVEWPTLYIRGHYGLKQQLSAVRAASAEMLEYVGEWHSHPVGASPTQSPDDRTALAWLTAEMAIEGRPGLMLIVGDDGEVDWCLGAD